VRIRNKIASCAWLLVCMQPWRVDAITLEEVMKTASEQHPQVQMAEHSIEAARGVLHEQSAYGYNPELSLEPQHRRLSAGGTSTDYYITLSQGIETAGKTGLRRRAAESALAAVDRSAEVVRKGLAIEAAKAFVELFFTRRVLDLRHSQSVALEQLTRGLEQQMEAGEANQLDVNLAHSSYTAALHAESGARRAFTMSQARYYEAIGQKATDQPPEPELSRMQLNWESPDDPFRAALASRPDLAELRARLEQVGAEAELARAQRIPDPLFSVMSGREDGEQLLLLGISIPIPLWNSHSGAYRAALAESARMQARVEWAERQLRLELQATIYNHADAMHNLAAAYRAEDRQSAFDNIKLAKTAFKAGELGLERLVFHISQGLNAQLTALDIMKQGWLARIRLAEALGRPEYILEGTQR
jgi:cobalt-zinc-cadmium efflux system outer membrane protein